jgi:hypothetical protein
MPDPILLAIIAIMLAPAALMFLERKPIRAAICLAASAFGGALLLLYLGQGLAALLQLLVFVGCLLLYLTVSAASENARITVLDGGKFFIAAVLMIGGLCLPFALFAGGGAAPVGSDLVAAAAASLESQYAAAYAAVFLVFASAIGAAIVIRKSSKVVV